jgi:hypothetical protein
VTLIAEGRIARTPIGPRFTQYVVPADVIGGHLDRALRVPKFNEAVSAGILLWPQARAKWDRERVCLVSAESPAGWHHDLWFPGYHWADTDGLWTVPGMRFHDGMESYDLTHSGLRSAVRTLQEQETAHGTWASGDAGSPGDQSGQIAFPVVLRFIDDRGNPAASRLAPRQVATILAPAFA